MNYVHVVIAVIAAFAVGQASVLEVLWRAVAGSRRQRAKVPPPLPPAREPVPAVIPLAGYRDRRRLRRQAA